MNILGPFAQEPGQLKHLIIDVGYFTKRVEVEPLANITTSNVLKFFKKNILARFRVPQVIVTYNGIQFIAERLKRVTKELKIKIKHFASIEHPQKNDHAEATNRVLV